MSRDFPDIRTWGDGLENFYFSTSRSVSSTIITESAPSALPLRWIFGYTAAFYLFVRTITGMNFTDNFYDTA